MFYRQSIVLFGFVVPFLVCAAIVGGGLVIKANASTSYQAKQSLYKNAESNRLGALGIEAQVSKKRPHVDRWMTQLEKETANSITSNLKEIGDMLPAKEFQQTAFERPTGDAGFATASKQGSSQVKLAFRGTFRSIQKAFLELETRMPQLQLQELKIDPSNTASSTLNVSVNYTAWEK